MGEETNPTTKKDPQDHSACASEGFDQAASRGTTVKCTLCEDMLPSVNIYWKGVEFCEHGVPSTVVPLCGECVVEIECVVREATAVAEFMSGLAGMNIKKVD